MLLTFFYFLISVLRIQLYALCLKLYALRLQPYSVILLI